jgi:GNAT-family acetyltransferase (TIGR03103 family)
MSAAEATPARRRSRHEETTTSAAEIDPIPRTYARPSRRLTTNNLPSPPAHLEAHLDRDVALDCGWGRLAFGHTFAEHADLAAVLREEGPGRRDIAMYVTEPHVFVAAAPHELFVDPSYTFRLDLHHLPAARDPLRGVTVRSVVREADFEGINRVYAARQMVGAPSAVMWANQRGGTFRYLVAVDDRSGEVVGTVTGIDHARAFSDPEQGSSLWCLAIDPQCTHPGVGEALTTALASQMAARGRLHLDLSVMHDNLPAIALYEKLGFERVPIFAVKRKNPINEALFSAPAHPDEDELNPYARIIADAARRRGVGVDVLDAEGGYLKLAHGGREVVTRESLSELTSAVAMSRCDDKRVTRRVLADIGIRVPEGRAATFDQADAVFLDAVDELVVKPARGEQGQGITVGVRDADHLERACAFARTHCDDVLLEERVPGEDLRIVVIGHEVVAAAVRRPATIVGTGRHSVEELIRAQSRRRAAATGGESSIPLDETTVDTVVAAGHDLHDVLDEGQALAVRRTANLHTGGTIHDVTAELHPELAEVATRASRALDIPVVGIDLMVLAPDEPDYAFIEANERPGLANHEPQPTAERFVDLLFPGTSAAPRPWVPGLPGEVHADMHAPA